MSNARFRPTRAGIINLWDYRDQEFSFADGRLVLRGPNGSGKTKALEVLFPFVFDGRIEPRRLNPFAGEERTMKSNLLYRGQDSAHSYVWMEFCRGSLEDPESVTVGIGMRATRTNDKVTRWYFVADGRVGVDFSLIGNDDRPLTKKQLAEQLGSDSITDRPLDYRTAIDARMFGLGVQRYDQLINLILTLRRPQLAKNLDPKAFRRHSPTVSVHSTISWSSKLRVRSATWRKSAARSRGSRPPIRQPEFHRGLHQVPASAVSRRDRTGQHPPRSGHQRCCRHGRVVARPDPQP